jgi:transcriptional regulator with XRE-family HTH domain
MGVSVPDTISGRLRMLLEAEGISVREFYRRCLPMFKRGRNDFCLNSLHNYVRGRTTPTARKAAILAKALGVSRDWLYYGRGVSGLKIGEKPIEQSMEQSLEAAREGKDKNKVRKKAKRAEIPDVRLPEEVVSMITKACMDAWDRYQREESLRKLELKVLMDEEQVSWKVNGEDAGAWQAEKLG